MKLQGLNPYLPSWEYIPDGEPYVFGDRLFAPDLVQGYDGRYYLYYVDSKSPYVSVAVCDVPAGRYRFYGYVSYPDGTRLGEVLGRIEVGYSNVWKTYESKVNIEDGQGALYFTYVGQGSASFGSFTLL